MVRERVNGLTGLFGAGNLKILRKFGYRHDRTRGDHAILKYTHPETGEKRTVTVPLHDRVRIGTLQSSVVQTTFVNGVDGSTNTVGVLPALKDREDIKPTLSGRD